MLALLTIALAVAPAFPVPKDRLDVLEKAEAELAQAPDDPKRIIKTALARKLAGHFDESVELLRSCKQPSCSMLLSVLLAMTDDAGEVVPLLEKLASVTPQAKEDQASSWRFLSQALVRAGRPDEAIAAAQKAVALVPAPMMVLDLAVAQFAAGQLKEAEASLDAVLAKAPTQQAALYWKYRCLESRGDQAAQAAARGLRRARRFGGRQAPRPGGPALPPRGGGDEARREGPGGEAPGDREEAPRHPSLASGQQALTPARPRTARRYCSADLRG